MSEIVERCARAVEDEYAMIFGKRCSTEAARRFVRRILEEMRDPTEGMIFAAHLPTENVRFSDIWRAMLDQAQR